MSSTETRTRNVSYWEARFLTGRTTLQEAVLATKIKFPDWSQRVLPLVSSLAPDGSVFLNTIVSAHGMVFCQMILFEPGKHHAALDMAKGKDSLDLIEIAPKVEDKKAQAEFLESILYFGVKGNHVILLQSQALRSRDLENYLNRLLVNAEAVDARDDSLSFQRGVALATKEKIAQSVPSKIRIGTPLFSSRSKVEEGQGDTAAGKTRVKLAGGLMPWLNKLTGNSLDEVALDNSIDPESIRVYVELSYRRKSDEQAAKVMEDLTHSLRHLHEDDVSITLPKTGVIKGDKLYVSTPLSVQARNGNLVEADLYKRMSEWLMTLLKNKVVDG